MSLKPERTSSTFPHFDDKYKCCCNTVHVLQGSLIIGIVSAIFLGISLFFALFSKEALFSTVLELILMAVEVLTLVLLFIGIKKYRSQFVLPFLIYSFLTCIFTIFLLVASTIAIINPDSLPGRTLKSYIDTSDHDDLKSLQSESSARKENVDPQIMIRILALFLDTAILLGLFVNGWFTWVIYKCFRYLKDLEQHRERHSSVSFNVAGSIVR